MPWALRHIAGKKLRLKRSVLQLIRDGLSLLRRERPCACDRVGGTRWGRRYSGSYFLSCNSSISVRSVILVWWVNLEGRTSAPPGPSPRIHHCLAHSLLPLLFPSRGDTWAPGNVMPGPGAGVTLQWSGTLSKGGYKHSWSLHAIQKLG